MTSGNVDLFTLRARGISTSASGAHTYAPRRDFFKTEVQSNTPLSEFVYVVNTQMLGSRHLTKYDSLDIGIINIAKDNHFYFQIDWAGNADLFIDRITIFNSEYDELYESKTITKAQIISDLKAKYGSFNIQKLQSFYYDEPFQLSARYRGEMQDTLRTMLQGTLPFMEINGAVGGIPKHFLDFDTSYAKANDNDKFVRHYINYNMYPIIKNTGTTTSSLQPRLDLFINYNSVDDQYGSKADPNKYKYVGILPAQISAQELEVPLVVTLCVAGEQYLNRTDGVLSLVDGPHRRRPPTPDEIKAMGNISLAYGAKGFMYYMVPTRTAIPVEGKTEFNQYGLFEEKGKSFDPAKPDTWIQNPAVQQDTNERYTAVREFISSTALIESTLLRLKWLDATGWSRDEESSINWIESVQTWHPVVDPDPDETTFVETGFFEELSPSPVDLFPPKYVYIVNRRCNLQEIPGDLPVQDSSHRYISIKFHLDPGFINYTIHDLKTNSKYFTTSNGWVTIYLKAGEGTLLRIEPTVQAGGNLVENEEVDYPVNVKSDLKLTSGKTLSITNGADMKFLNSSKLDVSSANLNIFTINSGPVKLDFISRNWTAGNGIIASGANVSINNAIIKNASTAIAAWNPSSLSISNSTIENCWFGVSVESRPVGSIYLDNVKVVGCSERGVTLGAANLEIKNSRISGGRYGINVGNGIVLSGDYNSSLTQGLDTLTNNTVGLYSYASTVDFGYYENSQEYNCINNLFSNNETDIYALSSSIVSAQHNYWDNIQELKLDWDLSSVIYTNPLLQVGKDSPEKENESEPLVSNLKLSKGEVGKVKEKIASIRQLLKQKKLKQARNLCVDIIENNSDDELIPLALRLLRSTYTGEELTEYKGFVKNGNNSRKGSLAKGLLKVDAAINEENPVVYLDSVASEYRKKRPGEEALYKKALYQLMVQSDRAGAKLTRQRMETDFPESAYLTDLTLLLSDSLAGRNTPVNPGLGKSNPETVNTVVYEYNLYNNYPNPFNPETVIKFSLKEKSSVTLTVYNITGQKVAELATGEMEKGMYEKRFNGISHSSGVYIFRLEAQSLESSDRYTKTVKAMLLK